MLESLSADEGWEAEVLLALLFVLKASIIY